MSGIASIGDALAQVIALARPSVQRWTIWARFTSRIAAWLEALLGLVRQGTTVPWRHTDRADGPRRVVVFGTRDVPRKGSYADALAQTAADVKRGSAGPSIATRIGRATDAWGRREFFPIDEYWTASIRRSEADVHLLSHVSISRAESERILDLLAGRPSVEASAPEALLLFDVTGGTRETRQRSR